MPNPEQEYVDTRGEAVAYPATFPISELEDELRSGHVLKKVVDLEIGEPARQKLFTDLAKKKGDVSVVKALLAAFPTRDFAHGNISAIDEYEINKYYEISLHLLNLNPKVFAKAALFFLLKAEARLTLSKSRDMAFIKELRTSWSGNRTPAEEPGGGWRLPIPGQRR